MAVNKCDVCGRDGVVGVASSPFAAVSWAYCKECLQQPATSMVDFAYLYDFVSRDGVGLRDEVDSYFTWRDGKYISWAQYVEWRWTLPVCGVHKTHMDKTGDKEPECSICGFERACQRYEGPDFTDVPSGFGDVP